MEGNVYYEPPALVGDLADGDLVLTLSEVQDAKPLEGWVAAYVFDMIHAPTGRSMGKINLRFGLTDELLWHGGQIGYAVDPEFRGHGYAARAVRLVLPLARAAGMDTVWITCDPSNIASKKSIENAGGVFIEERAISPSSPMYRLGRRFCLRYRFTL